jgi:hypothetical protein
MTFTEGTEGGALSVTEEVRQRVGTMEEGYGEVQRQRKGFTVSTDRLEGAKITHFFSS